MVEDETAPVMTDEDWIAFFTGRNLSEKQARLCTLQLGGMTQTAAGEVVYGKHGSGLASRTMNSRKVKEAFTAAKALQRGDLSDAKDRAWLIRLLQQEAEGGTGPTKIQAIKLLLDYEDVERERAPTRADVSEILIRMFRSQCLWLKAMTMVIIAGDGRNISYDDILKLGFTVKPSEWGVMRHHHPRLCAFLLLCAKDRPAGVPSRRMATMLSGIPEVRRELETAGIEVPPQSNGHDNSVERWKAEVPTDEARRMMEMK